MCILYHITEHVMNYFIKNTITIFLTIFLSSFLAGCGEKHDTNNTITVGTASEYPPFEFRQDDKLTGFDIELIQAFAKYSAKELKIVEMEFAGLIAALSSNKVDLVISAMNPTDKRKQVVDFSDSYYSGKPTLLVRKDSNIKNFDNLQNKILGVQLGSLWETLAIEKSKAITSLKLRTLGKTPLLVEELKLGRVDAVITEHEQAVEFAKANSGLAHHNLDGFDVGYAVAFRKNSPLVQEFNDFLKQFAQSGDLKALQQKWFK